MIKTTKTPWNQRAQVPTTGTPIPGACLFRIKSVQNVDPPAGFNGANYADAISYTVDVETPNMTISDCPGVIPHTQRWPRPWLVVPFAVSVDEEDGSVTGLVPGVVMNGDVYMLQSEPQYAAPCEGGV